MPLFCKLPMMTLLHRSPYQHLHLTVLHLQSCFYLPSCPHLHSFHHHRHRPVKKKSSVIINTNKCIKMKSLSQYVFRDNVNNSMSGKLNSAVHD